MTDDARQRGAAGGVRPGGVTLLVGAHPFQQRAAAAISGREPGEVIVEVFDYLTLGFDDEPETPPVPGKPGPGPDGERAGVPQRVEPARRRAELSEPRAAPGEVVALLPGRLLHRGAGGAIARGEGLPVVKRLGRNFARVIDPHQSRRVPALPVIETIVRGVAGRTLRFGFVIHPSRPAQRAVERDDEPVDSVDVAIGTIRHWTSHRGPKEKSTGHPRAAGRSPGSYISRVHPKLTVHAAPDRIRAFFAGTDGPRSDMGTFTAKPHEVERRWFVVDATGQPLGRLASRIAHRLRGKHKAEFTPHVDTGDYIIVVNAEKVGLTGNKRAQKTYYRHTGYPGGIRSTSFEKMIAEKPTRVIELAVKGMLPKGPLGRDMYRKLRVYAGTEHRHTAQQPVPLTLS